MRGRELCCWFDGRQGCVGRGELSCLVYMVRLCGDFQARAAAKLCLAADIMWTVCVFFLFFVFWEDGRGRPSLAGHTHNS
jgi:hypothetical protein